jgi:hypothetical protein
MFDVEHTVAGYPGLHGDGRRVGIELEVGYSVSIGGEHDLAAAIDREACEVGIEILAAGEAVDLDCDSGVDACGKHLLPPRLETGSVVKMASSRMGENVDIGRVDGPEETLGLVTVGVEVAVDGGDHAVHFESLASGDIECPVFEHLDFKALEQMMVLAVPGVPSLHPLTLETHTLLVEPGGDLEAAGVIGDHRPGVPASEAGSRHGFERSLAVRVPGMPVVGATQPLWVEIRWAGAKGFGHLGPAEVAVPGIAPTRLFAAFKTLHGGLQSVFAPTGHQLLYQRLEPTRCVAQQIAARITRAVESGVTGTQQCQSPVPGRLGVGEGEQRLGQGAVGDASVTHSPSIVSG